MKIGLFVFVLVGCFVSLFACLPFEVPVICALPVSILCVVI